MRFEEVFPGEEIATYNGHFYLAEHSLSKLRLPKHSSFIRNQQRKKDMANVNLEKVLVIDIETRGLAYRDPVWLIHSGQFAGDDLKVSSFFARDYGEEKPMLNYFLDFMHNFQLFVTFNGNSFDLRRISRRSQNQGLLVNGFKYKELSDVLGEKHIDLKPYMRSSLQHFEKLTVGHIRRGDVQGELIPQVYHDFLYGLGNQQKTEQKMIDALRHCNLDVVSTAAAFLYHSQKFASQISKFTARPGQKNQADPNQLDLPLFSKSAPQQMSQAA